MQYRFLAITTLMSLAACGEPSSPPPGDTEQPKAAEAKPVALGTPGEAEGLRFTVMDVATPVLIGPAEVGAKAEPGETFVVVSYTLKNISAKPLTMMERPGLTLINANGQSYAIDAMASPMAGAMMDDMSGMVADLNPNVSAKTKAAWKVDKASFDKATWRLVVAGDPQLTFALQ